MYIYENEKLTKIVNSISKLFSQVFRNSYNHPTHYF